MPKKRSRDTATDEPTPEEPAAADEPPEPPPPPSPLINAAVFPGDELCAVSSSSVPLLIGTGVVRDGDLLRSSICGVLRYEPPPRNRLWIDGETKRYIPITGDHVIGIIESKHAEEYRLNIGGPAIASLPLLAFDGATRRNRPHLDVGALVYARITLAHRDMDPECSCAAPPGVSAKDWVTRESVFGELQGGSLFQCPQPLCRRLMASGDDDGGQNAASMPPPVLDALGARAPFEFAVGANNRVWLASNSAAMSVLSQSAILRSHGVRDEDHEALVEELSRSFELPDDLVNGGGGGGPGAAAAADAFLNSLGPPGSREREGRA